MSCNDSIPISDIVAAVAEQLSKQYVAKEDGVAKDLTLKGDIALDSAAKASLCKALSDCFDDKHVSEFRLNGSDLEITLTDGTIKTVDLSVFNTPDKFVTDFAIDDTQEHVVLTLNSGEKHRISKEELAEFIKPALHGLDKYVEKNGGILTKGVLYAPTINGAVSLDSNATKSLCSALEQCIRDYIADTPFVDNGELVGSELVLKQGNTVIDRINLATLAGDGLEVRGGKLHIKDELCTLGVTNQSSYTVKDTDDVIVSDGGTITFPSSIHVGRVFTVIQAADTDVVLASDGTINPPLDKTLTMYGKNAVATVIKTGANVFYVSGDMK